MTRPPLRGPSRRRPPPPTSPRRPQLPPRHRSRSPSAVRRRPPRRWPSKLRAPSCNSRTFPPKFVCWSGARYWFWRTCLQPGIDFKDFFFNFTFFF
ncbi:rCG19955, isoform CRA_a [Rattus norvegicus]|uniref:RCG19955, isoform CRA_a n=1 Tax=Rattus norvegicus TaxID=10116 RepID=A6KID7_RAT|nr:rCG19955, isoform CRA_a [Rattus norvegicus]EDL87793.1 rCG19955, isoform CRA_a [Rattus norvegicus]